nr:hypothetical protein BaRGS_021192 [Batillaria attramentaria]
MNFPIVDVRDVALAHVRAMTSAEAAGHRHIICSNTNLWMSQMATLLKSVFGSQGYDVPTITAPTYILRLASKVDDSLKTILPYLGLVHHFDNTRMREVLEVKPRDVRDTLVEMAYAMIDLGLVPRTKHYTGPGGPDERLMYMGLKL